MGKSFSARYKSFCYNCDEQIEPGDMAVYDDDALVHEDCAPAEIEPRTFTLDPELAKRLRF